MRKAVAGCTLAFSSTPDDSGTTAAGGNKTRDALLFGEPWAALEGAVDADTVILEKLERDVTYLASGQGIVTDAFLDELETALQQAPRR